MSTIDYSFAKRRVAISLSECIDTAELKEEMQKKCLESDIGAAVSEENDHVIRVRKKGNHDILINSLYEYLIETKGNNQIICNVLIKSVKIPEKEEILEVTKRYIKPREKISGEGCLGAGIFTYWFIIVFLLAIASVGSCIQMWPGGFEDETHKYTCVGFSFILSVLAIAFILTIAKFFSNRRKEKIEALNRTQSTNKKADFAMHHNRIAVQKNQRRVEMFNEWDESYLRYAHTSEPERIYISFTEDVLRVLKDTVKEMSQMMGISAKVTSDIEYTESEMREKLRRSFDL